MTFKRRIDWPFNVRIHRSPHPFGGKTSKLIRLSKNKKIKIFCKIFGCPRIYLKSRLLGIGGLLIVLTPPVALFPLPSPHICTSLGDCRTADQGSSMNRWSPSHFSLEQGGSSHAHLESYLEQFGCFFVLLFQSLSSICHTKGAHPSVHLRILRAWVFQVLS